MIASHVLLFLSALASAPVAGSDFQETAKLMSSVATAGARFGVATATDGTVTAIGAYAYADPEVMPGSVSVFRGCSPPVEEAVLTASDAAPGDEFGRDVAVDGDVLLVGAPRRVPADTHVGAAYVFRFDGTQWVEEQKLVPSDGTPGDLFGNAIDLQGDIAVIGAPGHGLGAAYVFRFDGTQWVESKLKNPESLSYTAFGQSVCVDAGRIAVGAIYGTAFSWQGSATLFRDDGLGGWEQFGIAKPSTGTADDAADYFGASVALWGDSLLVGAPGEKDDLGNPDRGKIYVFRESATSSAWTEVQQLVPDAAVAGDGVGWTLQRDGHLAVASAYRDDTKAVDAGAAYLLRYDGTQWSADQKLMASDGAAEDRIYGVSIRGGTIVLGAYLDDDAGANSGTAFVFRDAFPTYGAGVAGAGGLVPTLDASGTAALGATLNVHVRDFPGAAPACIVTGFDPDDAPFLDGRLWVDVDGMHFFTVLDLPGAPGVAGEGDVDLALLVPQDPALVCANLYSQAFAIDPGSLSGIGMTNGLVISME